MTRNPERGSAMLVSLIIVAAMVGGAAVLISLQLSSSRSSDISRQGMSALHCAEAGLVAARPHILTNYTSWGTALAGSPAEPAFLTAALGTHDLDNDGQADFTVYLKDNDDELPPSSLNSAADNDLRVFVVSRCIKYPDTPKEVAELVQYSAGGTCYQSQQGGCGGNNNGN
jgi:hypothetical protein